MTLLMSDAQLLQRFRAGDPRALSAVYWHYVDSVKSTLKCCVRSARNQAAHRLDLADVLQDAFIKAFAERARRSYDARLEYKPFLLAVARNTFVDELRRYSREVHLDEHSIDRITSASTAIEEVFPWADPQLAMVVARHVSELDVKERAVYNERYVNDRSQKQTAATLALSRQQVRTLESRLCAGLARRLGVARSPSSGPLLANVRGRSRTFVDKSRGP